MTGKVLIVDDEPDIRELLEITLGRMSLQTASASSVNTAYELLKSEEFNLCLTDMRLPDGDGLDLVETIQQEYSALPVAVITAHGNTETAIRALKAGAFDFVSKPLDLQKLRDLVNAALRLPAANNGHSADGFISITGHSPAISNMKKQISRLARSQAPVYISGESGAGKELAARSIHRQSSRADNPFVAVNCGAIPAELMESELFGHLKGSFTGADKDKVGLFQSANGGTLFLDEVADLPLHMQVKLLRVIQEKSFRPVGAQSEVATNVRILSASHKNLEKEVSSGRFRQDLFYRINVIQLNVPSLRDRREDIPELSQQALLRIAADNEIDSPLSIDPAAMQALCDYDFPGNVRELENILQRAVTLRENNTITKNTLKLDSSERNFTPESDDSSTSKAHQTSSKELVLDENFSLQQHLESIEKDAITQALEEERWNKTAAAQRLGMTFRSLRYRMKKLKID
ncbi:MAG: sigma-54 dependent transcriptional regulator [Pseudohongiellaceae bacterium]|nr:sigma-54 dependent transcriptional regulator [Pseudohongiellaceae bacterium]